METSKGETEGDRRYQLLDQNSEGDRGERPEGGQHDQVLQRDEGGRVCDLDQPLEDRPAQYCQVVRGALPDYSRGILHLDESIYYDVRVPSQGSVKFPGLVGVPLASPRLDQHGCT